MVRPALALLAAAAAAVTTAPAAAATPGVPSCAAPAARDLAKALEDPHPSWIHGVVTSQARADAALAGRARLPRDMGGPRVVLVELKGRFVHTLSAPRGAHPPPTRYAQLVLAAPGCAVWERALDDTLVPLRRLGRVHRLGIVVRQGLDWWAGTAFRLAGATLRVSLAPQRNLTPPDARAELFGRRIRAVCAPNHADPKTAVYTVRRWPRGAHVVRFRLPRDIAARARWCLVEWVGGRDVASARMR